MNLDTSREAFTAALAAWGEPWPEYHDGQGFSSPLAASFAIPRVPHWAVINAHGKVVYLGTNHRSFLEVASRALRQVRGVEEEEPKKAQTDQ